MMNSINNIAQFIAALIAFMLASERPGGGKEKKSKVISAAKDLLTELKDDIPEWLYAVLNNDKIIGILVELLHGAMKSTGFLS